MRAGSRTAPTRDAAIARGAYQVLSLTGAYLTGPSRQLWQKLADQYLPVEQERQ